MTVLDFLTLTRRGWKILVLAVVIGALAGAAYGFFAPKVYQASSTGFIAVEGDSVVAGSDEAVARAGSYVPLINSKQVRDAIAKESDLDPSQLNGALSASVVPGSTMIRVTATSSSPKSALALANGGLNGLVKVIDEIESKSGNTSGTSISIIPMDNAVEPTEPVSPKPTLAIGIGALAGLVAGFIVIFLRRALDVRVRAHTDITELMGTGVLGRVPDLGRKGKTDGDSHAQSIANEAFRQIRTGLRFSSVDAEVRVVMITSANQGEGKSMVAASLARVMAESGQRTLIIDADLRRPKVAHNFGIDGTVGLSGVLSGQVPAPSAIQTTKDPNLYVLPAGAIPPNPSEMLGSVALSKLLAEFRRDFFIIIDAPPVLPVTDASVVSTMVDGVVFVLAVGQTRKAEGAAARAQLQQVSARLLGVVLNKVSLKGGENGYGYGYGYGYYRQNRSYYVSPSKKDKKGVQRTTQAPAVIPVQNAPKPQTAAAPSPAPDDPTSAQQDAAAGVPTLRRSARS
ncbi:polysaccharide biosynthesis tyrosine autokinase [Microbacterium bovistercoris]|uniref:polysaccharide biosynthesis tyrosine autokinase n=1 Tax=Microbacterium bovistercoris TaxID=2293570 RepID=UPI0015F25B96|nr:polysaccharide biosynthesis tyrosine autokinase [Microbacterium bovistercoris]